MYDRNQPSPVTQRDDETWTEALNRVDGTASSKSRFKHPENAKLEPLPPIDDAHGSATRAQLNTPYVNSRMKPRGTMEDVAAKRFYVPQNDGSNGAPIDPNKHSISAEQVQTYRRIAGDVTDIEKQHKDSHVAFYSSQPPELRIAQDLYRKVYEREYNTELPQDFHFLRYPGPQDQDFKKYAGVGEFLAAEMGRNGLIDDNAAPAKADLLSANLSLHGSIGHAGEETFHYFQIGSGATPPPVAKFMKSYLEQFGFETGTLDEFVEKAQALDKTPEGSIVQILVPKEKVDDVAYLAHPHGVPHDDDLLRDMHAYSPIEYGSLDRTVNPRGLKRETVHAELTRTLTDIRARWPAMSERSAQELSDRRDQLAKELHDRAVEGVKRGDFKPSKMIDALVSAPETLRHDDAARQAERMERNPEHFGGQGVLSPQEVMRIQNRPTFVQARILMSQNGGALDPQSGIKMKRYTTRTPEQMKAVEKYLDSYVERLFQDRQMRRDLGRQSIDKPAPALEPQPPAQDTRRKDVRLSERQRPGILKRGEVGESNGGKRPGILKRRDGEDLAAPNGERSKKELLLEANRQHNGDAQEPQADKLQRSRA